METTVQLPWLLIGGALVLIGLAWAFMAKFKSGDEEKQVDAWLQKRIDDPKTPAFVREQLVKARDLNLQATAQSMDGYRKQVDDMINLKARVAELERRLKINP